MRNCLFLLIIISCVSCSKRIVEYVEVPKVHTEYQNIYSVDTIKQNDSIFINQYTQGDTVYKIKEKYRYIDKWHYSVDTVVKVDSVPIVVEVDKPSTLEKLEKAEKKNEQLNDKVGSMWKWIVALGLLVLFSNFRRIIEVVNKFV